MQFPNCNSLSVRDPDENNVKFVHIAKCSLENALKYTEGRTQESDGGVFHSLLFIPPSSSFTSSFPHPFASLSIPFPPIRSRAPL